MEILSEYRFKKTPQVGDTIRAESNPPKFGVVKGVITDKIKIDDIEVDAEIVIATESEMENNMWKINFSFHECRVRFV